MVRVTCSLPPNNPSCPSLVTNVYLTYLRGLCACSPSPSLTSSFDTSLSKWTLVSLAHLGVVLSMSVF